MNHAEQSTEVVHPLAFDPAVNPSFNPYVAMTPPPVIDLARPSTRLAASVLDSVPTVGIAVGTALLMPLLGSDKPDSIIVSAVAAGVGMLVFFAYQILLIKRHGQTFGKRRKSIKVVRTGSGQQCGATRYLCFRVLLPALFGLIPLIGPLFSALDTLMIFGRQRRCLHDRLADTSVINVY